MSVGSVSFLSQGAEASLRKEGELTFTSIGQDTPIKVGDTLYVKTGEVHVKRGSSTLVLKEGANWQATQAVVPEREASQLNVRIEADVDDDGFIGHSSSQTFVLAIALPPANSASFDGASKLVLKLDGTIQTLDITDQMRAEGVVYMTHTFPDYPDYGKQYQVSVELQKANGAKLLTGETNMTVFEGAEPETPSLSVAIREDANNDGTLTEAEVSGKSQLSVDIKLDNKAQVGDVLSVRTNGGQSQEIVLTQQHINQKSVTVKRPTPAEGESLNVEARLEAQDGGRSPKVSDSATVEAGIADAPSIRIIEDSNNNRVLNSAELGNQRTVSTEITLGDGSKAGDRLLVWQNGPKNIRGWKAVKTLTQHDINEGQVAFEVKRPPEGSTLVVKTMLVTASGEKTEQSAVDKALIDTQGPKLTIDAADVIKAGESTTVTFNFDEATKGFQASDIKVTDGTISGFTKVSNTQWTAKFTSTTNDPANPQHSITVAGHSFSDKHGNSGTGDQVSLDPNLLGVDFSQVSNTIKMWEWWSASNYGARAPSSQFNDTQWTKLNLPDFTLRDSTDQVVEVRIVHNNAYHISDDSDVLHKYPIWHNTGVEKIEDISHLYTDKAEQVGDVYYTGDENSSDYNPYLQGSLNLTIRDFSFQSEMGIEVTTKDSQTGELLTQVEMFDIGNYVSLVSPLILDLDGDGVETLSISEGVDFDIDADGQVDKTGWVGKDDALLVRDINGDGLINDARELFGEETLKADGSEASEGFEALAELDSNGDGVFDSQDEAFNEVQLWKDSNSDGISQAYELHSLLDMGVASIDLSALEIAENNNGNIAGLRSSWTDAEGNSHTVDDIWFAYESGAGEQSALDTGDLLTSDEAIPGLVDEASTSSAATTTQQSEAQSVSCYGAPELQAEQLLVEQPQLDH